MARRRGGGEVVVAASLLLAVPAAAAPAPDLAGKILTVRGPIDPAAAGPTLPHEHVFIEFATPATTAGDMLPPAPPDPGNDLMDFDGQLAEILEFAKVGGGTLVDVTNLGLSRQPEQLRRVSEASGLHVVMGAGWYMRTYHPPDMTERTVEELTTMLVRDVTVGAQGTTVRAGIIGEVGVGTFLPSPLTPNEIKSVRASARAARLTGAPISVHSFAPPDEMQRVLDVIASEGVSLDRVVLSHTGTGNLAAMKRYTDRGAYVEFDYFGFGSPAAQQQDAERVAADLWTMIQGGLTDRILVSHDVCIEGQLKRNGGGGYAYVWNEVIPELQALGATDETVKRILVENPQRVLTFVAPQDALVPGR